MTDDPNAVNLRVNGVDFAGWKEVSISAGIERQARDFSLGITTRWPGSTAQERRVKPGDLCEVYIGADLVVTGFVDATPVKYGAKDAEVGVQGRSKTGDLVDCGAINKPGQWRNRKLEKIAADLAAVYSIAVITEVDTGAPIIDHQIQVGETAFECIDRMLRIRHVLATDNEKGELVFIEAGSQRASTALELGKNILGGDAPLDYKHRFSEYQCKGQRSGDDDEFAEDVAEEDASITDGNIGRRRLLVLKQSGQADEGTCRDRVEYERAHRAAKSLETTYTVQGWRQGSGELWKPNMLVRVKDSLIGFDAEMVIAEVGYKLGSAGMISTLKVGPVDGYVSKAARKKKGKTGSSWNDAVPIR